MTQTYKLEELAAAAGVSSRTVRYYVQRGLLPAPEFRGKDTAYSREHLLRLHAIKRLQEAHLPLDEIQVRLANATDVELAKIAREGATVSVRMPFDEPHDTATDKKGRHPYRSGPDDPYRPRRDDPLAPRPLPMPFPMPADPSATAHVYRLAPGVELWVRSGTSAASRALAREILERYGNPNADDKDESR